MADAPRPMDVAWSLTPAGAWAQLMAAAVLSQCGEWAHLQYMGVERKWWQAFLFALAFAVVEYLLSVNAERVLHDDTNKQQVFLMQIVWNVTQQIVLNLFIALVMREHYVWQHGAALGFLFAAVGFAAWGTYTVAS